MSSEFLLQRITAHLSNMQSAGRAAAPPPSAEAAINDLEKLGLGDPVALLLGLLNVQRLIRDDTSRRFDRFEQRLNVFDGYLAMLEQRVVGLEAESKQTEISMNEFRAEWSDLVSQIERLTPELSQSFNELIKPIYDHLASSSRERAKLSEEVSQFQQFVLQFRGDMSA